MPIPDDDRFEAYLKQFQPIAPDALPIRSHARESWRPPLLRFIAVAAVVIVAVGSFYLADRHVPGHSDRSTSVEMAQATPPLTMREANALLAAAPSYKAVVDNMAFHVEATPIPDGKQSALATLAKEKIKL